MVIDSTLLKLECELLKTRTFQPKLFTALETNPAFQTYLEHEKMLQRDTTEESVRAALVSFLDSHQDHSNLKLDACKDQTEQLLALACQIQTEQERFIGMVRSRLAAYTAREISDDTVIYLYALGNDGGFCLHEGELFLNILRAQDRWFDVLCHELYHSRELSETAIEKRIRYISMTDDTDPQGDSFLAELVEEGVATVVEYDGQYQFPMAEIRDTLTLLHRWEALTAEEKQGLRKRCATGKLRYQTAGAIAMKVYAEYGFEGLETWSADADLHLFRKALEALIA